MVQNDKGMNEQDEAIVRRFGTLGENTFVEVDSTIEVSEWGASKEQIYEFQTAFDIVSEGEKEVNENQVSDIFLAIGYTMQDAELELLFSKCVRSATGLFTYEVLVEGTSERIFCKKYSEEHSVTGEIIEGRKIENNGSMEFYAN